MSHDHLSDHAKSRAPRPFPCRFCQVLFPENEIPKCPTETDAEIGVFMLESETQRRSGHVGNAASWRAFRASAQTSAKSTRCIFGMISVPHLQLRRRTTNFRLEPLSSAYRVARHTYEKPISQRLSPASCTPAPVDSKLTQPSAAPKFQRSHSAVEH